MVSRPGLVLMYTLKNLREIHPKLHCLWNTGNGHFVALICDLGNVRRGLDGDDFNPLQHDRKTH